jgi:hypothetical protein
MPHPSLSHLAALLGTLTTLMSLYTFISPLAASCHHGFDLTPARATSASAKVDANAALIYVRLFGGRNLVLALFAFYVQRRPKAMDTVLMCLVVGAAVDALVTRIEGVEGMVWQHVVGGLVFGGVGWGLVR